MNNKRKILIWITYFFASVGFIQYCLMLLWGFSTKTNIGNIPDKSLGILFWCSIIVLLCYYFAPKEYRCNKSEKAIMALVKVPIAIVIGFIIAGLIILLLMTFIS